MRIYHKGDKFDVNCRKVGTFGQIRGLMFRGKNTGNLLFENVKGGIHSLFVFFSFLAVFLDGKNRVVDVIEVKPFRFHVKSRKSFRKLLEIPFNGKNYELAGFLVGKKDLNR